MAKDKTVLLVLCTVFLWLSLVGSVLGQKVIENYPILERTTELRRKLIQLEQSQVGVKELTGNNDGKEVEKYLRSVGLKKGNAWCAAGQSWCHLELSIPNPESGYSPDWFRHNVVYEKEGERLTPYKFRGGEVVGFWVPYKGRIGHVGMVRFEEGFNVYTTEFNYSNRVMNVLRQRSDIYIVADYVGYQELLQALKKRKK